MNGYYLGLILILISGIFQGTYGLGMKRFAPLSWESFWIIFSILSMFVIPAIWIVSVIPDPMAALQAVSPADAWVTIGMGALWGVGALLWGFAIIQLGLSLTYGIGMSITAISGSLGMLFGLQNVCDMPFFTPWLTGSLLMVLGVALITQAGLIREREEQKRENNTTAKKQSWLFYAALVGIFLSGIFSGLLNIGFNKAVAAATAAIAQGATPSDASLLQWMYVFLGGFVVQFIYAVVLMIKNKSYATFGGKGCIKGYITALLTAIMWYAALALYGKGSTELGNMGTVIGWTLFISLSLIVSNVIALYSGEWKGSGIAIKWLIAGTSILLIACIILGYSNSLT